MKSAAIPEYFGVMMVTMSVIGWPTIGSSQESLHYETTGLAAYQSLKQPLPDTPTDQVVEPSALSVSGKPRPPKKKITTPAVPPASTHTTGEQSETPGQELRQQPALLAMVKGFLFTGNTVVSKQHLESITSPYVGQPLTLPVLESAAQAVTDYYRKKGYTLALAYVPQQDVKFGVIELAVLEGRIGDVTVSGNEFYSSKFIKGHFAQAMEENVARNDSLERGLLLLNDYPGLKTSATLEPGRSAGSTDVHIKVEDKRPLHFMLDFNNYGFNNISRYRFGAGVEVGNVLRDGATLTLNGIMGNHPDQLLFGLVNYSVPIGVHGTKLVVSGSTGKFDVGAELSALQIRGRINTYDVAVTHPFLKSRFQNLLGDVGFSSKDSELFVLGNLEKTDAVRSLKLGMNWDRIDLSGRWYASLYGFQGLGEFMGGMDNDSLRASRQSADNRFTKGTIAAGRIQSLGHDMLLIVRGNGQATTGSVVVIEQMLLGGPDSVRGYQLGERFVDEGYAVTAETRIPFFPSLMPSALKQTQGVIFIDHGGGRLRNPSPGEHESTSLTGTGVGLQTQLPWYNTNFRCDVGFPLGPKPNGGTVAGDRSPIFYIQAATRF